MAIKKESNTFDFFTGLCASRKIMVKGKIEKGVSGTISIFNEYRQKSEKFNNCKGVHAEVFTSLIGKTVNAFGLSCTFKQGKNIADRYMVFDKMPKGLILKK